MPAGVYNGPACPRCRADIGFMTLISGLKECPSCRRLFEAVRFDPPQRRAHVLRVAEAGPTGAAPCGTHPVNASVASCDRCGVFMCTLCRIDVDAQVLCPGCFERLSADGALEGAAFTAKDYTRIGGALMVASIFCWPTGIVAGLAGVYYGVRGFRQKRAMGDTAGALGAVGVIVLGVLEAVGASILLFAMGQTMVRH